MLVVALWKGQGPSGRGRGALVMGRGDAGARLVVGQGPGRGRVWGVCAGPALTCWAQALLRGLNLGSQKHAVPSLAVALALEGKASHRELTSRLLSDLVGRVVSPEDIAWAFDKMLQDLPDLILDTPEAPQVSAGAGTRPCRGALWGCGHAGGCRAGRWLCRGGGRARGCQGNVAVLAVLGLAAGHALTPCPQMLGQFIARAVADHALPLDFLERYKGRVDCEHAR